jgi:hypothetical protein
MYETVISVGQNTAWPSIINGVFFGTDQEPLEGALHGEGTAATLGVFFLEILWQGAYREKGDNLLGTSLRPCSTLTIFLFFPYSYNQPALCLAVRPTLTHEPSIPYVPTQVGWDICMYRKKSSHLTCYDFVKPITFQLHLVRLCHPKLPLYSCILQIAYSPPVQPVAR